MRSRPDEEKPNGRALSNFAVRIRYGFLRAPTEIRTGDVYDTRR